MEKKKLVIIGAGFAGISLAKKLKNNPDLDVLLVDINNYHTFQPLLYQVATGGLEPDNVVYPIRRILRGTKVRFRMAETQRINPKESTITTNIGDIDYDYLVIACGSTNNFFNFEPIKDKLLPLKSITNALDIRSFLMQNLEKVITLNDLEDKKEVVNIAIIGGGPAGIELAGALAEMKKNVFPKDFPEFDFNQMEINLFEAADKLLAAMSEKSSKASLHYLEKLGVNVKLNALVEKFDGHALYVKDKEEFHTETVIWTAGVKGAVIDGLEENSIVKGNRVSVNDFNQVINAENIFAIGDIAAKVDEKNPKGHPMLAQVAIQQGEHLAKNLKLMLKGQAMLPFEYHNKGTMATIGKNKAVVDLPQLHFHGRLAWFLWMFIHLLSLVGFRNKLVTFIGWANNYINYDRPLGIIIRKYKRGD